MPPAPIAPRDGSSPPKLSVRDWTPCPFPKESDEAAIDDGYVILRVSVSSTGVAQGVQVLFDPGYGFGDAARVCALRQHYQPGFDAAGDPHDGITNPFKVHYSRSAPSFP